MNGLFNLIPRKIYRYIYEEKINISLFYRSILSIVCALVMFFLIGSSIRLAAENMIFGVLSLFGAYIFLILAAWFRPNCRESMLSTFREIDELKEKNMDEDITDEIDKLVEEIDLSSDIEHNKFNVIMLHRLGDYLSLFIYPLLQSNNQDARASIYDFFVKTNEIIKDKNRMHELPQLIEDLDKSLISRSSVKKSLTLYYEQDNVFFKQSITKRIALLREVVEEKTVIQKITAYLKENKELATALVLIGIYFLFKMLNWDIPFVK